MTRGEVFDGRNLLGSRSKIVSNDWFHDSPNIAVFSCYFLSFFFLKITRAPNFLVDIADRFWLAEEKSHRRHFQNASIHGIDNNPFWRIYFNASSRLVFFSILLKSDMQYSFPQSEVTKRHHNF